MLDWGTLKTLPCSGVLLYEDEPPSCCGGTTIAGGFGGADAVVFSDRDRFKDRLRLAEVVCDALRLCLCG